MDKKKKYILIASAIGVVFAIAVTIACVSLFQGFSATKYAEAVLEQTMEGKVSALVSMTKGLTEDAAKKQYETTVSDFVTNVVAKGLTLDDEQKKACVKECKEIFEDMKYNVSNEKKISDTEYEVTVTYKKSDVMTKLKALAEAETARINAKVENGEYRGTLDAINQQMQAEYATNLASMLKEANETMEFGDEESIVLSVKKGENGLYVIDGTQIGQFLLKIMGLGENQD